MMVPGELMRDYQVFAWCLAWAGVAQIILGTIIWFIGRFLSGGIG